MKPTPAPHEADIAAIASDPDAFEDFYRVHVEAVQRFVARRVDDRELAADLTADIFLAAIESAHTYRASRGAPVAWLFGVARAVVSSDRRRRGRERRANGALVGRRLLDGDDLARIDERIDAEWEGRRLHEAISALPQRLRAVLELVAVDELSVTQAAGALGISPLAARVRLHRARARLTERLRAPADRRTEPADQDGTPSPRPKEASL